MSATDAPDDFRDSLRDSISDSLHRLYLYRNGDDADEIADALLPIIARHTAQARANELEQAAEWLDTWPEDGGPAQNHCPETVDAIHGAGWAIVELRTYAAIIRRTLENPT